MGEHNNDFRKNGVSAGEWRAIRYKTVTGEAKLSKSTYTATSQSQCRGRDAIKSSYTDNDNNNEGGIGVGGS